MYIYICMAMCHLTPHLKSTKGPEGTLYLSMVCRGGGGGRVRVGERGGSGDPPQALSRPSQDLIRTLSGSSQHPFKTLSGLSQKSLRTISGPSEDFLGTRPHLRHTQYSFVVFPWDFVAGPKGCANKSNQKWQGVSMVFKIRLGLAAPGPAKEHLKILPISSLDFLTIFSRSSLCLLTIFSGPF